MRERFIKIFIILLSIALLSDLSSLRVESATRRIRTTPQRNNTPAQPAPPAPPRPAQNPPATQPQSGQGDAMTPEQEQALMDSAAAMRRSGLVQFNFKDFDLVRFMRFMSEVLQENIIVPPNINSKITIISPHPVTIKEAREIMLSTLQMYNFSLQNMGSYSIVRQGGNSPSPNVFRSKTGPGPGEETVTYIVPIDYVTIESLLPAIQQAFFSGRKWARYFIAGSGC